MVTASEFVLFPALRKVDFHATQHETIFLCPNYELIITTFLLKTMSQLWIAVVCRAYWKMCQLYTGAPALGPEFVNLVLVFPLFPIHDPASLGFALALHLPGLDWPL